MYSKIAKVILNQLSHFYCIAPLVSAKPFECGRYQKLGQSFSENQTLLSSYNCRGTVRNAGMRSQSI